MFIRLMITAIVLSGALFWRLLEHDLDRHQSEAFEFSVAGNALSGTLWLPRGTPVAAIVLVHGDGPQDRSSSGGYAPFINAMLDHSIAVASWDKPGVGRSEGNWLMQSMVDRTDETQAALRQLRKLTPNLTIGALGFSQAGWVLPGLKPTDADFLVLIGPAVNWQDQGNYFATVRLTRDGIAPEHVAQILEARAEESDLIFSGDQPPSDIDMPAERWQFIATNRTSDASTLLEQLDLPLLAIWGGEDLNVDPDANLSAYEENAPGADVMIFPDATHGLLKSGPYNWQLTSQWSLMAKLRFLLEGRYAYAPGVLNIVADWIKEQ